ncbi:response regulator [Lebetimonas sp. JH292]|uniref:response regulator n=1 Tax=Lebetimonas sp. JH292 TaxID=990068 RepID=UPI000466192C|nr:response regulator [Lebetimonas sp. JH292]
MRGLKNLNVLFVEDDEMVREAFSLLVKDLFNKFFIAEDAKKAIEIFNNNNLDLIITDIKMPEISGLELSEYIKNRDKNIIILVITAFSDMDYMKKAIDIGIDGYLTKPIFKDSLFKTLKKFAKIINERKETKEYLEILKNLIEEKNYPICICKNNQNIICNKPFKNIFGKINDLEEFEDKFNIEFDFKKEKTEKINNKKFLIKSVHFPNDYYKIEFKELHVL